MATINGTSGDDLLFGGKADDSLFGKEGNDVLTGGRGADLLDGGGGNDTANYSDSLLAVKASLAGSIGWGAGDSNGDTYVSIENLTGSDFDDLLIGDGLANVLDGGTGNDVLHGYQGDDTVSGGFGNDHLTGGAGLDILDGGSGADILIGGEDSDLLTGGDGDDYFFFNDLTGNDVITDFTAGVLSDEIIDISNFGFVDFATLLATMSENLGDTLIQLDVDDSVLLEDVAIADLTADDFLII